MISHESTLGAINSKRKYLECFHIQRKQVFSPVLQVDDFELAVETPKPAAEQPRRGVDTPEGDAPLLEEGTAAAGAPAEASLERISQWVANLPELPAAAADPQESSGNANGEDANGRAGGGGIADGEKSDAEDDGEGAISLCIMQETQRCVRREPITLVHTMCGPPLHQPGPCSSLAFSHVQKNASQACM